MPTPRPPSPNKKRGERAVDNLTNVTVDNNETIDIFYFKLVTYR